MFMKTMAVGPFDPVATSCLTGATVALPLRNCSEYAENAGVETVDVALFAARARGVRRAIVKINGQKRVKSGRKLTGGAYGRRRTPRPMWNLVCMALLWPMTAAMFPDG
jgi:hypothetical protein